MYKAHYLCPDITKKRTLVYASELEDGITSYGSWYLIDVELKDVQNFYIKSSCIKEKEGETNVEFKRSGDSNSFIGTGIFSKVKMTLETTKFKYKGSSTKIKEDSKLLQIKPFTISLMDEILLLEGTFLIGESE